MADMGDKINFVAGRTWRWHGDVTTDSMFKGHWADEPCELCLQPSKGPTMKVISVDHERGVVTYDVE